MNTTPRTDKKAQYILSEFGPNNNGRFAAMADFSRELERENASLLEALKLLAYGAEASVENGLKNPQVNGGLILARSCFEKYGVE